MENGIISCPPKIGRILGKWDNQLSAKDWENLGNALDEFANAYGGDSIAEVVDSVAEDYIW